MDQPVYTIPPGTRIGHVHLKVADLNRALDFYCGLLGFELIADYGTEAAFLSAGGYHHHIGLNTQYSKNSPPAPIRSAGLFHTAILYPTRRDLAAAYRRLLDAHYPLTGVADHGVSEALYLNDPDRNGVELYWDRPRDQWPAKPDGSVDMYTHPLDLEDLLRELAQGPARQFVVVRPGLLSETSRDLNALLTESKNVAYPPAPERKKPEV